MTLYSQYLYRFLEYLQKGDMGNSDKTVNFGRNRVNYETDPIICDGRSVQMANILFISLILIINE
jgi:glucose-6-phosphate isomerase